MAVELETPVVMNSRWIRWGQFDNGRQWLLMRGEDFDQTPQQARQSVRQWAHARGRRVSTKIEGDALIIQLHPAEPARPVGTELAPEEQRELDDSVSDLCDHPRLVPRLPCGQCDPRDPLKARFG